MSRRFNEPLSLPGDRRVSLPKQHPANPRPAGPPAGIHDPIWFERQLEAKRWDTDRQIHWNNKL